MFGLVYLISPCSCLAVLFDVPVPAVLLIWLVPVPVPGYLISSCSCLAVWLDIPVPGNFISPCSCLAVWLDVPVPAYLIVPDHFYLFGLTFLFLLSYLTDGFIEQNNLPQNQFRVCILKQVRNPGICFDWCRVAIATFFRSLHASQSGCPIKNININKNI